MHVKFEFFKHVASILNPFLKMYQTAQPTMPFLSEDLEEMYRRLTKMVVHKAIIDKSRTQVDLIKINLDEKLNMLPSNEVKLLTATLHLGKRLRFKADCGLFVVNLLRKNFTRKEAH